MAKIIIELTIPQAEALLELAEEGAEGILTDQSHVDSLLRGSTIAAENALKILGKAVKGEGYWRLGN